MACAAFEERRLGHYRDGNAEHSIRCLGDLALSGGLHEWFADGGLQAKGFTAWLPPMAVLAGLAWDTIEADPRRRVFWVGRRCWPYPPALIRRGSSSADRRLLDASVFIDPASKQERIWAIELAARCVGVAVVVADGRGLTMAESRRLQLAASGGGQRASIPVLLTRPAWERRELSAARTRWCVTPRAITGMSEKGRQGWSVELLHCKGMQPAGSARCWVVRRDHVTGRTTTTMLEPTPRDGDLATGVVDRPVSAARAQLT